MPTYAFAVFVYLVALALVLAFCAGANRHR